MSLIAIFDGERTPKEIRSQWMVSECYHPTVPLVLEASAGYRIWTPVTRHKLPATSKSCQLFELKRLEPWDQGPPNPGRDLRLK